MRKSTQRADISNVTVNDNTWVPKTSEVLDTAATTGAFAKTCDLPAAMMKVYKADNTATGAINETTESVQLKDVGVYYRQVDCKYIYNLDVSSLTGVGSYTMYANINGSNVANAAMFDLR